MKNLKNLIIWAFILTRQPYAGIICLAILVVKGLLIGKGKSLV